MEILLVLAHGLFGWGDAASSDSKRDYFYGIKPFLTERCRAKGLTPTIIAPTVSPRAGAATLKAGWVIALRLSRRSGRLIEERRSPILFFGM